MEHLFLDFVQNEKPFAWLYQFLIMVLVSMIPFAPIPVLAAFIASNHDFLPGLLINMLGTMIGSLLLYLLSKRLLRRVALKYLTKRQYLTKYFELIETHGFLAVLLGRIIPILPSAGINLIAGISNVSFVAFIAATFLGKLPTILAFSLVGHQMAAGNWDTVLIIALYLFALFLLGKKLKHKWSR
ncbi:VTT domain-containing protein [Solibacillus sp. MA9]|uniref:TVP38/TMEM64 family membrane protein n=1 Tax=Solibacillus palustris TaxID=2908203 RepID=A0ABS9UFP6_9BACL|nr:VTT domain-containing protein [Solibacillus sp. MA9]MCH7322763.1 VTT domain-containing protein [Solibacillus sp. MA9]